jgi:hypothetical protein
MPDTTISAEYHAVRTARDQYNRYFEMLVIMVHGYQLHKNIFI